MNLDPLLEEFTTRDWQTLEPADVDPVRVAVVGIGQFARREAIPALVEAEFCTPTICVTSSTEKADRVAAEFDLERGITYDAYHRGEASEAYDAVYISTPTGTHLEYATTAADLGKHVLCEKPIETTVERARRLVGACEDADVALMVAYRMQLDPTLRRMRALLDRGTIGEPRYIHGSLSIRIEALDTPWRFDPDLAGGGALMDVGIYPVNASRFLLDRDPRSVVGTVPAPAGDRPAIEEDATAQLAFPDGAAAVCTASYRSHWDSHLRVVGTAGRLRLERAFFAGRRRELVVETGDRTVETTGRPVNEIREQVEYFAHCILTDATPEPDGTDGCTDLAVIEGLYRSIEDRRQVSL